MQRTLLCRVLKGEHSKGNACELCAWQELLGQQQHKYMLQAVLCDQLCTCHDLNEVCTVQGLLGECREAYSSNSSSIPGQHDVLMLA